MYTNIIHNDDICNYFLKNQQFIFNSLGNCRECRLKCEILHILQLSLIIGNSTDLQGINRAAVSGYKSICNLIYIQWKHKLLIFVDMDQMI